MGLSEADKERLLAIEALLVEHSFPPQIVIENTSICTMRCAHCSHREMKRPRRHMERWMWNRLVEEIGSESPECEIWPTFYGEALLLGRGNELWDRLDYAARVGCRNQVLNSNGMLLDRWDNLERVLDSPLRRFILSLDGFTTETFEAIRVGGKRDHIFAQVERLLERRAQRGLLYPTITCQFSRMKSNEHELETFRRYWQVRGAEVKTRPMLEWTTTGTVRTETIDHETSFRIACPWGNNTMAIHQNGDAVGCAVDYEGRFKAGNAGVRTLSELWGILGDRLRKPHREHRWAEVPEVCQGCGDWQTAGAEYERERTPGTRPFWFSQEQATVEREQDE